MKTSEFKNKIMELGYFFNEMPLEIIVSYPHRGTYVNLSKENNDIVLDTRDIELAKLCIKYAETPIQERNDIKKYTVVVPDPEKRGKHVLALGRLVERKGEIIIMRVKKETLESDRCQLTESEIKKNHAYLWQFAKEI